MQPHRRRRIQIGDGPWLRVPVGKLRNDRIIPLHPELVELLAEWTAPTSTTSADSWPTATHPSSVRDSRCLAITNTLPLVRRAERGEVDVEFAGCVIPVDPLPVWRCRRSGAPVTEDGSRVGEERYE